MTAKRIVFATVLTQLAGLSAAAAQPEGPPDEDEAQPADVAPVDEPPEEAEPEEVEAEEVAAPVIDRGNEVGYDKGFFIKSGDGKYELKLSGRIQPFYSGTFNKGDGNPDKHAFEIRRTRLTVDAKIHQGIGWKLQWDYGKGFLTLKDAHFDWKIGDDVWIRVGQWKRPFSRQQINSSGRLELTTRAITDSVFGAERDIGLAIRNDYEKSPNLEWIVGVFNGQGVGSRLSGDVEVDPMTGEGEITGGGFTNVPSRFKPAIVGRVGLNEGGLKGYQEVDLEGGPLRWGVGASVWLEADRDKDDKANQKVQLDYIVKVSGFSTTGGVYGMSSQQGPKTFSDQGLSHVGFHVQAGYLATPSVQVAARYALVDVQTDFESSSAVDTQELGLGASYFVKGHDAKFQTAVRVVKPEGAKLSDSVVLEVGANVGF